MSETGTVLVTGGSGYIGSWCVAALLQRGYTVRTSVRDLARADTVRDLIGEVAGPTDALSFVALNLTSDDGWDAAAAGCDYVLHVASPLGVPEPKDPQELIAPARDGALRAIGAAIKAGVKRVVMTSSVAAASPPSGTGATQAQAASDETVWTDPAGPGVGPYSQSKTIAERAAWDLVAKEGGATTNGTTLAVVNPALVLGPVMGRDFSDSVQVVQRLLTGKVPGIPNLGFNLVDVRDVADLHLRAMTDPAAAGQRFIAASDFLWMGDMARLLREHLGADAARVPTRKVPDFLLRIVANFDRDLKTVTPNLSRRSDFSSAKARATLGWTPRSGEESVLDCARSLIAHGLV